MQHHMWVSWCDAFLYRSNLGGYYMWELAIIFQNKVGSSHWIEFILVSTNLLMYFIAFCCHILKYLCIIRGRKELTSYGNRYWERNVSPTWFFTNQPNCQSVICILPGTIYRDAVTRSPCSDLTEAGPLIPTHAT